MQTMLNESLPLATQQVALLSKKHSMFLSKVARAAGKISVRAIHKPLSAKEQEKLVEDLHNAGGTSLVFSLLHPLNDGLILYQNIRINRVPVCLSSQLMECPSSTGMALPFIELDCRRWSASLAQYIAQPHLFHVDGVEEQITCGDRPAFPPPRWDARHYQWLQRTKPQRSFCPRMSRVPSSRT